MYYLLFPVVFVVNYMRQISKWLTKGFFRTFKHAYENTKKQVESVLDDTEKSAEPEFRSPRFLTATREEPKKRKRRGHRGGRKHRRNKKKGNRHDKV